MKKHLVIIMMLLTVILVGCGGNRADDTEEQRDTFAEENVLSADQGSEGQEQMAASEISESASEQEKENESMETDLAEHENNQTEEVQADMLNIQIGNRVLSAKLDDNTSVDALKELLAEEPLTIEMSDYGSFEKVGPIGERLPSDDEQITTSPGDIMLYSSSQIVLFYGSNSWTYTPIGRIEGMTGDELKEVLGADSVEITFSLP